MGRLKNKTAIITGGTKGIGLAAAELFIKEGANVVICGRGGSDDGAALAAKLGANCRFFALNVSDYKNWKECIDHTLNEFGKLDILINNAGISVAENIEQATPESYDRIIDVNQRGVFYGMKLDIRVNAVAPGYIMTLMAVQDAAEKGMTIEQYETEMAVDHTIGHLGKADDVARAYLYLASDDASFVTGTTLMVDGGYTAK